MASVGGRYQLVFNGEIYNFVELRDQLRGLGHSFRGGSDTEVMLAAFVQWGVAESLPCFNGMFAFALRDLERRELTLARDHYGKKPLYYRQLNGAWVFASELKALHHPALELDRAALASYFRFGYVPAPSSIYKQLKKLPPASLAILRAGKAEDRPNPFWSLSNLARSHRPAPENSLEARWKNWPGSSPKWLIPRTNSPDCCSSCWLNPQPNSTAAWSPSGTAPSCWVRRKPP